MSGCDTKCYDLAEAFLEDEPTLQSEHKKKALAMAIQDTIEGWIDWERDHAAALASHKGEPEHD